MGLVYQLCTQLSDIVASEVFEREVVGQENLILEGPALIAANHLSYLDPPLIGSVLGREIFYLARKTLFDAPLLGWLLPRLNVIPVDRDGADMTALKVVIRMVKQGNATIVFPEGTRSVDGNIQPARAGLGLIIAKTLAPVVPVRIIGSYEAWPKGAKLPRSAKVRVVIGKPICFGKSDLQGDPREVYQRLSQQVMDAIAALK